MSASLLIFLHAASLTAVLLGLVDAAALTAGGSSLAATIAAAAVLCAFSLRLAEAGAPLRAIKPARRGGWLGPRTALAMVAMIGWLMPALAPWAGARGGAAAFVLPFLILLLPLSHVAGRLADVLTHGGNARRELFLPGALAGAALTLHFGLGPIGWAVACLAAWLTTPVRPPERGLDDAAAGAEDAIQLPAGPLETGVQVLTGAALAGAAVFLLPLLELYDGSSSAEDLRRLLALGLPAVLAGLLFGSVAGSRWRLPLAACAAVAVHYGLGVAAELVSKLEDPRVFASLLGDPRVARFTVEGAVEGSRLSEDDLAYTPYLALRLAGFLAVCGGILLRMAVGARGRTGIGAVGLGAGLGLAWLAFDHSHTDFGFLTEPLPWLLFAAGGLALASPLPLLARLLLSIGFVVLPWAEIGAPLHPETSAPFYDSYEYPVATRAGLRGELRTPATRARMIRRLGYADEGQGADPGGHLILADGRNFLRREFHDLSPRTDEAAFLAAAAPNARAALLVGPPHTGTLRAWNAAGIRETGLACDPPALVRLADRFDPDWRAVGLSRLTTTVAEAEGSYDLILVRDEALWQRRRNPLRASLIVTAAARLAPQGRMAVSFQPSQVTPEVVGGVVQAMRASLDRVELWILPQGWREPRLLVLGGATPMPVPEGASALMRVATDQELEQLPSVSLQGPLSRAVQAVAGTEYRRPDKGRSTARAGRLLTDLRNQLGDASQDSLLGFYADHLRLQVYEVRDDYDNPPEKEWLDLDEQPLAELYRLSRLHPDDPFLRDFWRRLAPLVVAKREAEWALRYFGALTAEGEVDLGQGPEAGLGWREPDLLFAAGQAWQEMLIHDEALATAEQALDLDPAHFNSLTLRAQALAGLERHAESLLAFRKAVGAAEPAPPPLLLVAWAEEALASGDPDFAAQIASRVRRDHGDSLLSRPLRQLFGLGDPDTVHLYPGMEHEGG